MAKLREPKLPSGRGGPPGMGRSIESKGRVGDHGQKNARDRARAQAEDSPASATTAPSLSADEQVALILRTHLRRAMRWRGLSSRQTSLQAGQSEGLVKQVLAGNIQVPRSSTLNRIADVLGVTERFLIGADLADRARIADAYRGAERDRGEAARASDSAAKAALLDRANRADRMDGPYDDLEAAVAATASQKALLRAGPELPAPGRDLPVYASAAGGAEGQMIMSYDPIEYIHRPEPLIGVDDGFGSYIIGESNAPKYKTGDLALVHGSRTPMPGDWVWIVKQPRENEFEVLVKKLVRRTQREVIVQQLNPLQEFGIPTDQIHRMYQIVGSFERR
jgi:phage repressor protein C with HTH and peptisase S24 domain